MKNRQVYTYKDFKKQNHELLDKLLEYCYIDALTGRFHCKICHNVVHIDWSRQLVFCSIHGMLS